MKPYVKKIIAFVTLFYLLNLLVGYVLYLPVRQMIREKRYFSYQTWKDYYSMGKGTVDLIFLGSSHAYMSFNPLVFDGELGINSFNLGSSAQAPRTSYYVFKQALITQKPKLVIMEINHGVLGKEKNFSELSYSFDYFRDIKIKSECLLKEFRNQDWLKLLLPSLRYANNWKNLVRLIMREPLEYQIQGQYIAKGYVGDHSVHQADEFSGEGYKIKFENEKYVKEDMNYIQKIRQLCQNHHIKMVLVTVPIPPSSKDRIENYVEINAVMADMAKEFGVSYIDYNLPSNTGLAIDDSDFQYDDHLNYKGAMKISAHLANMVRGLLKE